MNQAFAPRLMRPNLPLRRPATGPGLFTPRCPAPPVHEVHQEQLLASDVLEGPKGDAVRKENSVVPAKSNCDMARTMLGPLVKLCNYCSHQGNFRCTRCKKTCYCSVACQTEDWKAHRHVCKPSNPEVASEKAKESTAVSCGNGLGVLQAKDKCIDVQAKRVYRRDMRKNTISKATVIQGTVIELRNPGKFFIHLQSVEMMESLKNITTELQKAYSTSFSAPFKLEVGELCAVKFSLDRNWYRAEVQSVDVARRTASVVYIDFGNEEEVTIDNIRPLSASIDTAPPFALECCVAGVTPLTGTWTGECTIAVQQMFAGKSLTWTVVDVMNDGTLFAVDVPLSTLGKYLSTFLIDQGYAVKVVPDKPRSEQDINSLLTASFENFKRLSGGKNENSEARPPEPLTQGVGDTFTAIVTHIQSPSEILCQKLENACIIQQLQMSLREHCLNTPASENFRPAPGTVCCSLFFEDNQWYRAKVLAYSSEDRVCIGYIDFGNSEEVELQCLRPISMELLALATQAIPCCLADIKPPTGTWSEEAILMVKSLVCNRFIRVVIMGKKDGKALVTMTDESSDPQTNPGELLVTMGYAVVESVQTENKEPAAQEQPQMPSLTGPASEKLEWTCAELPFDGQKVELVVSTLKRLDEFYCYNYSAGDVHVLTDLNRELMKHCESQRAPFTPNVGEPCCALFPGDGQWYRAMVMEVCGVDKARVYFVDFGNSCEVESSQLKAISQILLKLPYQAIRCWLAGVEPVEAQWSKESLQRFHALCASQQLSGKVLSITEKGYGVELESGGQSIAALLISEQLAKPYGQKQTLPKPATSSNQIEALPTLKPIDQKPPAEETSKVNNKGAENGLAQSTTSSACFHLNWKTLELPCNEKFQPRVAAVISPSLFYVMNPGKVNAEGLKAVMTDVAKYCSRQATPIECHPLPGAACCAQFSGDKNWYRAVVLEVTSKHAHVIYADYGNMETVPVSNIRPITKELLQHPFQIVRCALEGNEHFPSVWPAGVLELFGMQLSRGVVASVQRFNGTSNLLTLTQPSGQDDKDINSVILRSLDRGQNKANSKSPAKEKKDPKPPSDEKKDQTQTVSTNKATDQTKTADVKNRDLDDGTSLIQSASYHKKKEPENASKAMTTVECTKPDNDTSSKAGTAPPLCCCLELKQKIDRIEELILLLIKNVGGTK
ncbi:tudor domain-containing protein 1 [Triplophysa rosa]|uniref:Tudor domain-containing protein 1 n=1 Tax=Triplophysa rosa TaxID=992332 RepID=A0A9W7TEH8_TRIRA|nr:tudor domain-containing protein 1 [Triplophysa rosa]KAI7797155.1 tudor domain-containing protein 1 [Triplophysa rosa]